MSATSAYMRLFIYCLVGGFVICNLLSTPCHANEESDALIDVKNMLQDPQNVLQSWDSSLIDPCTWFHVTCNDGNNVYRLELGLANLSGTLSPRIGDLPGLQYLDLYFNSLNGSLPSSLGNLKNLLTLSVEGNRFTGEIPSSIAQLSNLRYLGLQENRFTGNIPSSIAQLSNLSYLNISDNKLSGAVPTGGAFSKFKYDSFKGNPELCGDVVRKPCPKK